MRDSQDPFPESPALAGVKTSPTFSNQGHCIFILILFFSLPLNGSRKWRGSCGSSSGLGRACYPDPDLMFRLTVTSPALRRVTEAEDAQPAAGSWQRGGWRHEAGLQHVCLPLPSPLCTPASEPLWPNLRLTAVSAGRERAPVTSPLIRPWHV